MQLDEFCVAETARLPQEVCDEILTHLSQDPPSLAVCGLVCRAWAVYSRRCLFHSVLLDLITRKSDRFLDLLEHPSSLIPSSIREVELATTRGTADLVRASGRFPSLAAVRRLTLYNHAGIDVDQPLRALHHAFTAIVVLSLTDVDFLRFEQIISLICGFPLLKTLKIDWVTWSDATLPPHTALLPEFRVLSLHEGRSYSMLLDWFLDHKSMLPVNTLDLGYAETENIPLLLKCFTITATTLTDLTLHFTSSAIGLFISNYHVALLKLSSQKHSLLMRPSFTPPNSVNLRLRLCRPRTL